MILESSFQSASYQHPTSVTLNFFIFMIRGIVWICKTLCTTGNSQDNYNQPTMYAQILWYMKRNWIDQIRQSMCIWHVIYNQPTKQKFSKVQSSEWVEKRADEYASHIFCVCRNCNCIYDCLDNTVFLFQLCIFRRLIPFTAITAYAQSIFIKTMSSLLRCTTSDESILKWT